VIFGFSGYVPREVGYTKLIIPAEEKGLFVLYEATYRSTMRRI
jgi:hypothetical protein